MSSLFSINQLRALVAALLQQWVTTFSDIGNLSFLILAIPTVAVIAWIASQSDNPTVLAYVMTGAPLMSIWNGVIFRVGWSLNGEIFGRTLELTIISRTPIMLVMLGKTLAQITYGIPAGIISVFVMFLVTRHLPSVAEPGLLLLSFIFVLIGLVMTSLSLTPIMVLSGGRAGFFNAIIPFGVILNGFLFPVAKLPIGLEIAARFLPTSWAMQSVWYSIQGPESFLQVLGAWAMCILTTAGWFVLAYLMFRAVEKRIRVTGVLGTI